ncbi:inorganic phosphate transporter [Collybia nuda]|uniref:Inorganic phosphate transporter n=1 Tax=Collybia nuda TaxID=64659 RepID=A0A9P6CEX1_9AGAR|nr:inorganic phosphate transporter [Collybia nuda]
MNSAIQNLVISLGAMQVARKIPFEDPQVLRYVRVAYITTQAIILGVYYITSRKIQSKNDLTLLKYVEPPGAFSEGPGQLVTTTVKDYDLAETSKLLRAAYMGIGMMSFMHLYLGYTQPLFVQALMGIKNLYDAKLVEIHLLGKPAVGDLKRPFKSGSLFGAAVPSPQTDKASVSNAEKRVGSKKEEF